MKSAYYTAVCANTYRMAIDKYLSDPENYVFDPILMTELESVSHREYDTGYYFADVAADAKTVTQNGYVREKAYVGVVSGYDESTGRAEIIQRNKLVSGETVEVISPGMAGRAFVASGLKNEAGEDIDSAPHPLMKFTLDIPFPVGVGDIVRR